MLAASLSINSVNLLFLPLFSEIQKSESQVVSPLSPFAPVNPAIRAGHSGSERGYNSGQVLAAPSSINSVNLISPINLRVPSCSSQGPSVSDFRG